MTFYASDWAIKQGISQNDYTGVIVGIQDPLKDNRAQVRIPYLHEGIPNELLPWFRNGNIQNNVNGATEIKLPVIGATVKVSFENDDFYTGTFYNGYKNTNNNSSDSFLNDYGTFDGWKDQWGNYYKINNNGSFTFHSKGGITISINGTEISINNATNTTLDGNLVVKGNLEVQGTTGIEVTKGNITATWGTITGAHLIAGDGASADGNSTVDSLRNNKVRSGIITDS